MRATLALVVLAALATPAQATDSGAAPESTLRQQLDALPEVAYPVEAPQIDASRLPEGALAPLPPEISVIVPAGDPDPSDTAKTETTAEAAPALAAPHDDLLPPDLPGLDDPNALIAILPPRPPRTAPEETQAPAVATPAPVAPPVLSAPPVVASPAPPVLRQPVRDSAAASLDRERLDAAFADLSALSPSPAAARSLRAIYEKRSDAAIFASAEGLTATGRAVIATAKAAGDHGLDPARFRKLIDASGDALSERREAALAMLAAAYARDARGGRIDPRQVSRLITATPTLPDNDDLIGALAVSPDAGRVLEDYNPTHPGYRALKAKLADLRATEMTSSVAPRLTFGPLLTQGMSDERVPLLRGLVGLPPSDSLLYDAALAEAVRAVQRERGLKVTGRLDRATVAALGGVDPDIIDRANPVGEIIANMERWRWLPRELGTTNVFVNIPSFGLVFTRDGETALTTRVVVGKPETQTPVFSHRMQFLVVNPSWNVPPSIAMKELLPLVQKNPGALAARGLQVIHKGRVVDPASIDWSKVGRTVAIRQPPGERNALGHVKFMFPNEHAVYLHDTPSRSLFANERRAYSHGCVRVQDPFRLAEAVMGGGDWTQQRLRGMVGGGERQINLPADIPVHLAYFTYVVTPAGTVETFADLYGHSRKLRKLLGV